MEGDLEMPEETPTTSSQFISPALISNVTSQTLNNGISSSQSSQNVNMNKTLNSDEERAKKYVVSDLPSLCFPMVQSASLRPIDLTQPLPMSNIGADTNPEIQTDSHRTDESYGLRWSHQRSSQASARAVARHRHRMARKKMFFKLCLQNTWFDDMQLLFAVIACDAQRVERLLEEGINANISDRRQRTPLHLAASQGYDDIVRLLLSKRANPNLRDTSGNTPLHLAVCLGARGTIKLLIDYGANMFIEDNCHRTPLSLVKSRLRNLRRNQTHTADELKNEFSLISYFLNYHATRAPQVPSTSMDDLCHMMESVSTREQADELADAVIQKMSSISIHQSSSSTSSAPQHQSPLHSIL